MDCSLSVSPLSPELSRQEYWSGLPFPPPGDHPNLVIKSMSPVSPALAGRFFTTSATWEDYICTYKYTCTLWISFFFNKYLKNMITSDEEPSSSFQDRYVGLDTTSSKIYSGPPCAPNKKEKPTELTLSVSLASRGFFQRVSHNQLYLWTLKREGPLEIILCNVFISQIGTRI